MQTYYGKPVVMGPYRLVTAWESKGVLFHNPRCLIRDERGTTLEVYPFHELRKALDRLIALSLPSARPPTPDAYPCCDSPTCPMCHGGGIVYNDDKENQT